MSRTNESMLALAIVAACAMVGFVSPGPCQAGVLNPAPPSSTGQTTSYGAGDDGALREGVEWPDPRFTDNLDGTVTDHLTGLVWLQDATRFSARGWNPALNACNNLANDGVQLTDGSVAGDWRLPNNRELRSLIDYGNTNPALPTGHPFIAPQSGSLWTSTTATNNTGRAWRVDDGLMLNDPKNTLNNVWPVRDGATAGPAPLPRTGQSITYGNRDDGELQQGVEWPEPRFSDNLDGTVTDHLTGLIWLQNAVRFPDQSFAEALDACNALADDGVNLTDRSVAGAWRLPNVRELGSLWDYGEIGPALPVNHPFSIVNATFWTSTTTATNSNRAWTFGAGIGRITDLPKGTSQATWPVRGANAVPVDVKPGSCPNPLNFRSRGKVPVAILGTPDLDVTTIDPVTIRLAGVAPIRSAIEDVGAPFEPYADKTDCELDCWEEGPDGWPDLTLKFETEDVVAALGPSADRECRVITLTGHLTDEFGGTPIEGEDVLRILNHDDEGDEDNTHPTEEILGESAAGDQSHLMRDQSARLEDPVHTTRIDDGERGRRVPKARRRR